MLRIVSRGFPDAGEHLASSERLKGERSDESGAFFGHRHGDAATALYQTGHNHVQTL